MAIQASETVAHLALERKRDEDEIMAEASFVGDRLMAYLRIGIFLSWGLANSVGVRLVGEEPIRDTPRAIALAVYILLAIWAVVGTTYALRQIRSGASRPSIRAAQFWPYFGTTADFAFVAVMHWRDLATHQYTPDVALAPCAVFLAFQLTRFTTWQVGYGTVLAIVTYLGSQVAAGYTRAVPLIFVSTSLLGMGVLIGAMNRYVRRMFVDVRRRDNLRRFLPSQIADRVLKNGDALKPASREVTILFTDIRDFTSLSEHLPPGEVLAFLDRYFGHMSQIVKGHDGVVNKFLGDGMLAVWGVPDRDALHAEKALKAALDMRKKLVEFNQERTNEGKPTIRMGIGIHTGLVAAGMLGGADQHEYTVIGDAVNLASRIEGLTKSLGVDLLVSEKTWSQLQTRFEGQRAGEEKVKGRNEPVVVYTVAGFQRAS
ncbi:MAG: adenylate/guanylate cyclase domain-containing protein [Myxococcaceae bacterium]